jgi:hypothetical protein
VTATVSSIPTETNNPDPDGLSAGVIAGAVAGSVAGLALIVCGLILAFRKRRQSRDGSSNPHRSLKGSMKPHSRPFTAWSRPEPPSSVPVIQPNSVGNEGFYVADTNISQSPMATTVRSELCAEGPAPPPVYTRKEEGTMESPASSSTAQGGHFVSFPASP